MRNRGKLILILETKTVYFVEWLSRYVREAWYCPWASDGEQLYHWRMIMKSESAKFNRDPFASALVLVLETGPEMANLARMYSQLYPYCWDGDEPRYYPDLRGSQIQVAIFSLGDTRIKIELSALGSAARDFEQRLLAEIGRDFPVVEVPSPTNAKGERQAEPTPKTEQIFEVIKRLKEADPDLTQDQTAVQASQELDEEITVDTLRYVCQEMSYKWKRGKRTRW